MTSNGFRAPPRREVTVRYGGDLAGLEVTVRAARQSTLRAVGRVSALSDAAEFTPADAEVLLDLFDAFGRALIAWNLVDDDGVPVPATVEGIADQDDEFLIEVVLGWLTTVSTGGASIAPPFDETVLPMAVLEPVDA